MVIIFSQVCPNGIICFGKRLQTYSIPQHGESRSTFIGRSCLAPYFSDLTTYRTGDIYYRYIDTLDKTNAPEIEVAKTLVQQSQALSIQPVFIIIATWDRVPHFYSYNGYSDDTDEVSFCQTHNNRIHISAPAYRGLSNYLIMSLVKTMTAQNQSYI